MTAGRDRVTSKGAIIIALIRQLVLARRKAETWRELTHRALDALADVTRDRDRVRRNYHALLDDRRRAARVSNATNDPFANAATPPEDRVCG